MSRTPILPDVESDGSGLYSPLYGSLTEESTVQEEYIARTGPHKSTPRHQVVLILIFMVIAFERLGYYSLTFRIDQILYERDNCNVTGNETRQESWDSWFLIFGVRAGGQFIFPLAGAWLGECVLGVHRTAILGTVLEVVGSAFLVTFTIDKLGENITCISHLTVSDELGSAFTPKLDESFMLTGLHLVMIGVALTRSNFIMLAASQIPENKLKEKGLFRWYYVAVNTGPAVAMGVLSWTTLSFQAWCWPACFLVSLLLLIVVRCISQENLNKTSMRGHKKLRELRACKRSVPNAELPLYRHIIKLIIFTCAQIPYFFTFASFLALSHHNDQHKVTSLYWYDPITIILLGPLAYYVVTPAYKKYYNDDISPLKIVLVGKLLIICACAAAIMQSMFVSFQNRGVYIATQFPQYFILGIAEIFVYAESLGFVYLETPKYMKNQMLGLYLTALGLGYLLRLWADVIVTKYIPLYDPAADTSRTDSLSEPVLVLGTAACLQLVFLIPFLFFMREYKYRDEYVESISKTVDGTRPARWFGGSSFEETGEYI